MKNYTFFLVVLYAVFMISCEKKASTPEKVEEPALTELLSKGVSVDILIDKSDYKLSVFFADKLIKEYNVVFGGNPVDDKEKEGDKCTPEGVFGIRDKYPHARWSKFIWIDYPNAESWKKFNQRRAKGIIKENESIGGEVGIHGVPEGMDYLIDEKQNWTLGCISLKNKDVDEIYPFITKKSKITIQK